MCNGETLSSPAEPRNRPPTSDPTPNHPPSGRRAEELHEQVRQQAAPPAAEHATPPAAEHATPPAAAEAQRPAATFDAAIRLLQQHEHAGALFARAVGVVESGGHSAAAIEHAVGLLEQDAHATPVFSEALQVLKGTPQPPHPIGPSAVGSDDALQPSFAMRTARDGPHANTADAAPGEPLLRPCARSPADSSWRHGSPVSGKAHADASLQLASLFDDRESSAASSGASSHSSRPSSALATGS